MAWRPPDRGGVGAGDAVGGSVAVGVTATAGGAKPFSGDSRTGGSGSGRARSERVRVQRGPGPRPAARAGPRVSAATIYGAVTAIS